MFKKLFRQHVEMLRAEVKQDLNRSKQAALLLGAGALVSFLGALLLLISVVYGVQALWPNLPHWACWAIVGAAVLIPGLVVLAAGQRILEMLNPLPEKSMQSLEEDFTWMTKSKLPK